MTLPAPLWDILPWTQLLAGAPLSCPTVAEAFAPPGPLLRVWLVRKKTEATTGRGGELALNLSTPADQEGWLHKPPS